MRVEKIFEGRLVLRTIEVVLKRKLEGGLYKWKGERWMWQRKMEALKQWKVTARFCRVMPRFGGFIEVEFVVESGAHAPMELHDVEISYFSFLLFSFAFIQSGVTW